MQQPINTLKGQNLQLVQTPTLPSNGLHSNQEVFFSVHQTENFIYRKKKKKPVIYQTITKVL